MDRPNTVSERPRGPTLPSASPYVLACLPHADHDLIPPTAHASLRALADALPRTAMAGFETPLVGPSATPDVSIRATRTEFRPVVAAIRHGRAGLALRRLVDACEANPEHWFFGQLPDLWLEFDADPSRRFSAPSLFFATSKVDAFSLGIGSTCPSLLKSLLRRLTDSPPNERHTRALDRCFAALGERDFIAQVGCMLGRGVRGTRVLVESTDPFGYLRRLDVAIDLDVAAAVLKPYGRLCEKLLVSLDVDGDIRPRVGLELIVAATGEDNPRRWSPILDRLREQGLCDPVRADALLAWCGAQPVPGLGADRSHALTRLIRMQPVLERRIGHVKTVFHPDRPPSAKAYYGYERTWSPTGSTEAPPC